MNLFKRKPEGLLYSVPQSAPFDGQQIKLATYQDKLAADGLKKIRKQSAVKEIQICKIPNNDGLVICADGNRAGTVWKTSWSGLYEKLKNHKIKRAFLSVSDDVYLFIE